MAFNRDGLKCWYKIDSHHLLNYFPIHNLFVNMLILVNHVVITSFSHELI
jgi:hypothetical protein